MEKLLEISQPNSLPKIRKEKSSNFAIQLFMEKANLLIKQFREDNHELLCRIPLIEYQARRAQGVSSPLHRKSIIFVAQRWNFDVVAHGPSLQDENIYYVIRRFDSLTQREQ